MALLAIEVSMQVVEVVTILATVARSGAHCIFKRTSSIVDGMKEMMSEKQGYASVYS